MNKSMIEALYLKDLERAYAQYINAIKEAENRKEERLLKERNE